MKFLITSAGITNDSIRSALLELLGKPIADSKALCISTATYGHPMAGPEHAWRFISGQEPRTPMCELGWKSLGVLELTALPSIDEERWVRWVQRTDVLLVNGGDPRYLCYWMRQSGLADLLFTARPACLFSVIPCQEWVFARSYGTAVSRSVRSRTTGCNRALLPARACRSTNPRSNPLGSSPIWRSKLRLGSLSD